MEEEALEPSVEAEAPEAIEPAPEPEAPSKTTRDAIDRAFAKVEKAQAEKAEPQAAPKAEDQPRAPDGKFASKEPVAPIPPQQLPPVAPVEAAPARFVAAAKADWAKVPQSVRSEILRTTGELEKGLNEYRAKWEPLREFDELARQTGTTVHDALRNYVGLEQEMRRDFVGGMEILCRNFGVDLRAFAQHVLNTPEKSQAQIIAEQQARQQRAELEQRQKALQQREQEYNMRLVESFWASHPRADELSQPTLEYNIPALVQKGLSLDQAYTLADRMNPAAPPEAQTLAPPAPAQTQSKPPAAQTSKLSVHGAPGSTPPRTPSKNSRDAVDRALQQVGVHL